MKYKASAYITKDVSISNPAHKAGFSLISPKDAQSNIAPLPATFAAPAAESSVAPSAALARILIVAMLLFASAFALCTSALAPERAYALDVVKCTARANSDSGSDVLGATETRVTWEGQAAANEQVEGISLTFPEGTTFSTENARVTALSGEDMMDRQSVSASFSIEGQTLRAEFRQATDAGAYLRLEVYGVYFPAEGGEMNIAGAYAISGTEQNMDALPAISVTGKTLTRQIISWLEEQDWVKTWNSNKFLFLFLNPVILVDSFPVVFKGFLMALGIVACAFPLAIPFGLLLSLMRMARFRLLRGIASAYVNIVRGTPLFLQIYIAFFGLPLAGIKIPEFLLGVLVLAMNSSAYLCEIFRAGIQSINKGQFEASRSLGMNAAQTMLFVIIPQTIRRVIPTMTSEFILLYKDTSMLAAVGFMEVVMYAKTIVASTGSITPYIVAACFYLVITLPLARLVGRLERKLAGNDAGRVPGNRKNKRARIQKHSKADAGAGHDARVQESSAQSASAQGIIPEKLPASDDLYITPEQMSSL